MQNYLADQNKFALAGPPDWFLRQLYTFDPSLVVVPSRQGFYYRLAQRRKLNLAIKFTQDLLWQESDTQMLASYGLVPVTTILATVNWSNPYIFVELANRAPWRMGGADKVNAQIEAQEQKELLDKQAKISEHTDYLAKDSWKYYQKLIGIRSHLYSPATKQAASTGNKAPEVRTQNKTVKVERPITLFRG